MAIIGTAIAWVLQLYMFVLLARMLLSWVSVLNPRYEPKGLLLVLFELVFTLTDPPIKLVRQLLPPGPRLGAARLDLGFLVVFIAVALMMRLNAVIFFG